MSSYIISRAPEKYGSRQSDYVEQTQAIVKTTVGKFHEAVERRENLNDLFHHTLGQLGSERHRIAVEHKTDKAELFGLRRDDEAKVRSFAAFTPLHGQYLEYGEKLLKKLQSHVGGMKHTLREFQEREKKVPFPKCHGRASHLDLVVFDNTNQHKHAFVEIDKEAIRIFQLLGMPVPEDAANALLALIHNVPMMKKLKEVSINDYKRLKVTSLLLNLRQSYEGRKSDWILATPRFQVDGKMYALTQYITWCNRDFVHDPVQAMTGRSIVSLVHQDAFLIDATLKDVAKIFERAMQWNRQTQELSELQNDVAALQYELAHTMPFVRGSAAVSEWLEQAIYGYHGFQVTYNPNKMVDLEAQTSSFHEFLSSYPSMVELS